VCVESPLHEVATSAAALDIAAAPTAVSGPTSESHRRIQELQSSRVAALAMSCQVDELLWLPPRVRALAAAGTRGRGAERVDQIQ
jgi:hypothetical protein